MEIKILKESDKKKKLTILLNKELICEYKLSFLS